MQDDINYDVINHTTTCDAFNVRRQGICDGILDESGECPNAAEHGDSFTGRA